MDRRRTLEMAQRLVMIGLMSSLITFVAVTSGFKDRVATIGIIPSDPIAAPIASVAPVTVSLDPQPAPPAPRSAETVARPAPGAEGEAGAYLRDSAAAAKRYPWAGPWRGETRTDLWINAPGSIGSTSPPRQSPVPSAVGT